MDFKGSNLKIGMFNIPNSFDSCETATCQIDWWPRKREKMIKWSEVPQTLRMSLNALP